MVSENSQVVLYDVGMSVRHIPWASIENFHNMRRSALRAGARGSITYKAKVKLHGTNGGVAITHDGHVAGFSRNAVLSQTSDNAGFHTWIMTQSTKWSELKCLLYEGQTLVVYGEWCGQGIQKGTAVNKLAGRIFAVFAARIVEDDCRDVEFIIEPTKLSELVGHLDDVHVIPWFDEGRKFTFDVSADATALTPVVDEMNEHVLAVEQRDPWIASAFNVEGIGEGLVFYPVQTSHDDVKFGFDTFAAFGFKAKGEKHRVVSQERAVQANSPSATNIEEFVKLVVTPARLEQGARACAAGELNFDVKSTGDFLKWMSQDITKETVAEVEASGIALKPLLAACCKKARDWYIDQCNKA